MANESIEERARELWFRMNYNCTENEFLKTASYGDWSEEVQRDLPQLVTALRAERSRALGEAERHLHERGYVMLASEVAALKESP